MDEYAFRDFCLPEDAYTYAEAAGLAAALATARSVDDAYREEAATERERRRAAECRADMAWAALSAAMDVLRPARGAFD